MDVKLREFRKQAREENRGRSGLGRRYSGQLRLEAVAYLKRKKREGENLERVASELGVSNWSLTRWARESETAGMVRRVEVEDVNANEFSLITPRGYRVEGLSEESVVRLIERLG